MLYARKHDVHKTNVPLLKYLSKALTECAYLDSKPIPEESLLKLFEQGKVSAYSDEHGSVIFRVLCESHPLHSSVDVCPIYTTFSARHFNENAPDIQLAILVITVSDYGTGFRMEGHGSSPLFRITELQSNDHTGLFRKPMGGNEKATLLNVIYSQNPTMDIGDDDGIARIVDNYQSIEIDTTSKFEDRPAILGQLIKLYDLSHDIGKQSKLMGRYKINYLALKLWLECYGLSDLASEPTIKELTIGEKAEKLPGLSLSIFAQLTLKKGIDIADQEDIWPSFTVNEEGVLSFKHYSDAVNTTDPLFNVLCYGIFAPKI